MEQTNKLFTLATLGKLYTDAAEAGGIEVATPFGWEKAHTGPTLSSRMRYYRPKQVPLVLYKIKHPNGLSERTWTSYESAEAWIRKYTAGSTVIKFTEEV